METIIIALVGAAAGCLVAALLMRWSGVERRRGDQRRVRALEVAGALTRVIPQTARSREDAERALARCGIRVSPIGLWGARIACLAAGLVAGLFIGQAAGGTVVARAASIALGVAAGAVAPQLYLLYRRGRWRDDIERELPNALDLLCVCVQAGSTFEYGVRTVSTRTTGALADALAEVVQASAFMPTTQALKRLADNAEIPSLTVFVASLIEAEQRGIQLVGVLKAQAASVRAQRRLALEEQINKLPLKMTFPLLFIFSSLLLILLTPALLEVLQGLTSV